MQVELNIYSGRPNPGWRLSPEQVAELGSRLAALPLAHDAVLPEPLGYRGLTLTGGAGAASRIDIGSGVVLLQRADGSTEHRSDHQRSLERWLLGTAKGQVDDELWQMVMNELGAR